MADRFPSLDEFDAGQTDVRAVPTSTDAASFLDRERALLGDDADQFATAHDHKATTVEEADDDDLLGGGYTGDAETMEFESSFPEIDTTNEQLGPGGSITGLNTIPGATSYPPPIVPEEEPEIIKEWRATRDADIERRDRISAEKREVTIKEAREQIDSFYDSYNDKKEKNIAATRREAEQFLASRDDTTAGGTSWERIGKLVDLSGKGAKGGAAASGKDRFREMLVSLRKDEKAPGASGL